MDSVVYIFGFLGSVASLSVWKKTKEKINIITNIMISYCLVLCMGSLGGLAMSMVGIKVNLLSMGIIFTFIMFVIVVCLYREKERQQIFICKSDFGFMGLCVLLVVGISLHVFTPYIHWNYINPVDPSNHFKMAMKVVRKEKVSGMFFSALYNGMIINLFKNFIPKSWMYKPFIIADAWHTLVGMLVFYSISAELLKNSRRKYLPFMFTVLYWLGFPLFSYIEQGYIYWLMSGMLIMTVLMILKWYVQDEEQRKKLFFIAMVGGMGVTFCYILFAPGIFLTLFATIIYNTPKEKKFNKSTAVKLIIGGILAVIGAIIGLYMIFGEQFIQRVIDQLNKGTMECYATELLLMSPVIAYILIYIANIKKSKWSVFHISLFSFTVVYVVMFFLSAVGKTSLYYLFKNYLVLWILFFLIAMDDRSILLQRKICFEFYLIVAACFVLFSYNGNHGDLVGMNSSMWNRNLSLIINVDFDSGNLSNNSHTYLVQKAVEEGSTFSDMPVPIVNPHNVDLAMYEEITYIGISIESQQDSKEQVIESFRNKIDELGADYFVIFYDDKVYREYLWEWLDTLNRYYENDKGFIAKVNWR